MQHYLVLDKTSPRSFFGSTRSGANYAVQQAKKQADITGKPIHVYKDGSNGDYVYVDTKYPRKKNSGDVSMSTDWVPCHAYRKLPDGTVQVLKEDEDSNIRQVNSGRRKRVPNIAQGFWANGVFHPIRASEDYDPKRAGEGGSKKKTAAKKKKPAKKVAKKAAKKKVVARTSSGPSLGRKPAKKKLTPYQKKRSGRYA